MFFKYPWAEIRCGWLSNVFPDSDIMWTLSKFKHYDASIYNHWMFLIYLAKHTDTLLSLNEPNLLSKDLSTQTEDARVIIVGSHQSFEKRKTQETVHSLSQSVFVLFPPGCRTATFLWFYTSKFYTIASNNLPLHKGWKVTIWLNSVAHLQTTCVIFSDFSFQMYNFWPYTDSKTLQVHRGGLILSTKTTEFKIIRATVFHSGAVRVSQHNVKPRSGSCRSELVWLPKVSNLPPHPPRPHPPTLPSH